jgi:RimJ/RimL family protein N-acetyltransferase
MSVLAMDHIRPIVPEDAVGLIQFHDQLSDSSRYFRFFSVHPTMREDDARHFATVDGVDRMAFVAEDGGAIIGVGRYDRDPLDPDTAEVAFAVSDEHQGHGIGTSLLRHLAAHAGDEGITRFKAWVLPTNHRMLDMFRDVVVRMECEFQSGVILVQFDLDALDSGDDG